MIAPLTHEERGNFLPAYEEALRSTPYTSGTTAHLIETGEIYFYATSATLPTMVMSSDPNSTISSTSSSESENYGHEPLSWRGVNMSRVPSYATALRTAGQNSSELPTYDSIAIA